MTEPVDLYQHTHFLVATFGGKTSEATDKAAEAWLMTNHQKTLSHLVTPPSKRTQEGFQTILHAHWQRRVQAIEAHFARSLPPLADLPSVADVRWLGAIGVVETREPIDVPAVQRGLVARGIWLRPFGRLLYAMPPYVIGVDDLGRITDAMGEVLREMA